MDKTTESELWIQVYPIVMDLAKRLPRKRGVTYSDSWILLVYLWAVVHDRPQGWGCHAGNWPEPILQGAALPSEGRLSVRLRQFSLRQLLQIVMAQARTLLPEHLVKCIDAKPLPVGSFSKDRDARWGQAGKAKAKGYKLFAVYDDAALEAWQIGSMNYAEPRVAQELVPQAACKGGGYLLGDSLYDTNPLHATASACGMQLLAPRKKPGTGLGWRKHQPSRLRSIQLLEGGSVFGRELYAQRINIEHRFAQTSNLRCGLGPLPNWVRRPHRVALWVACKLLLLTLWNSQPHGKEQGLAA